MKRLLYFLLCFVLVMSPSLLSGCKKNNKNTSKNLTINFKDIGVWWWDTSLDADTYLDFAIKNGVTEIYYSDSSFNEETANFITKANKNNIKVYFLDGNYNWLDINGPLFEKISNYQDYQKAYPNSKFAGIHLDIEPHQNPNFENERTSLIENLIKLAKLLNSLYPEITFDYDIPFWLDDEVTDLVSNSNNKVSAYKQMISLASRVFIMSYRDSAEEIYNISKEELSYANQVNKNIMLSVATKSNEGDIVSFMEETQTEMISELNKLSELVNEKTNIAIHNIKSWYELKI